MAAANAAAGAPFDEDLTPVNSAADPCSDFARFACGPENAANEASAPRSPVFNWRLAALKDFLERTARKPHGDVSPSAAFVTEYYRRCTDPAVRNAGGTELATWVDGTARIASVDDLARTLGRLRATGFNILIRLAFDERPHEADRQLIGELGFASPVLPRPLYAQKHHLLEDYRRHWKRLGELTGIAIAGDIAAAARIDALLAKEPEPDAVMPSHIATFEPPALAGSRFPWNAYLSGLGLTQNDVPLAWLFQGARDRIDRLATQPLADLKSYVRVLMVERMAEYVSVVALEEETRFHQGAVHERPPPDFSLPDLCVGLEMRDLEAPLAAAYLLTLADRASESTAGLLFSALRQQAALHVRMASWLDEGSRLSALRSVGNSKPLFVHQAGAPEVHQQPAGSLFDLFLRDRTWRSERSLKNLGHPIGGGGAPSFQPVKYFSRDGALWISSEIVRRPYVRSEAFNAITFGALGSMVGAGAAEALVAAVRDLDDRKDPESMKSAAEYRQRSTCLMNQVAAAGWNDVTSHDGHKAADHLAADLTGVTLALELMEKDGGRADSQSLPALEREFFLSYAQAHCRFDMGPRSEVEELRSALPPPRVRINSVASNLAQFSYAFHCAAGSAMSAATRCAVW